MEDAAHGRGRSEAEGVGCSADLEGEFVIIDLAPREDGLAEVGEVGGSAGHEHGPVVVVEDGQVAGEVIVVDQVLDALAEGEDGGIAEAESDVGLVPGADAGGDADGFGWARARAGVAGDEEEDARVHGFGGIS